MSENRSRRTPRHLAGGVSEADISVSPTSASATVRAYLIAGVLALVSSWRILGLLETGMAVHYANGILGLVTFGVCFLVIGKTIVWMSSGSRLGIESLCVGILAALSITLGARMEATGQCWALTLSTIRDVLLLLPATACFACWVSNEVKRIAAASRHVSSRKNDDRFWKVWLLATVVIFLCWLPVWLALFPGVFAYDTIYELSAIFNPGKLNAHHPLPHALLLSACIGIGAHAFGSATIGGFLYTLIQTSVMATCFGWVVAELYWLTQLRVCAILSMLWFGFAPIHVLLAVASTKDVLFGAFFLMLAFWMYRSFEEIRSSGRISLRTSLKVGAFAVLAVGFRNNMFTSLAVFTVLLIGVFAAKRTLAAGRGVVLPLVAALLLHVAITGPVYQAVGVSKETQLQETMSFPLQQLARAVTTVGCDISAEDRAYIEELIPAYTVYRPGISDSIKASLKDELLLSDPGRFVSVWLRVVSKNPIVCCDAFVANTYRLWYVGASVQRFGDAGYHPYIELVDTTAEVADELNDHIYWVERHSLLPGLESLLLELFGDEQTWATVPVLATLLNTGGIVWPFVLMLACCIREARWKSLLPVLTLLLLYWSTLLFGPVVLPRYEYPLYCCLPMLFCCFAKSRRTMSQPSAD